MGGFQESCTYTRQAGNDIEVDVANVEELIMERAFLRRNRDFSGADEVRDALAEIGVRVLDKEYEWYAMRKRTAGPPRERNFGPLGHDYTRAADDQTELTDEQTAEINELIRKRLEAKMSRSFEEADVHYKDLKEKFNVSIYDGRTKSWRADGGNWAPPGYTRAEGDVGEVDMGAVAKLIDARIESRRKRDYNQADILRKELQDLGVYVDDKERSWSMQRPQRA